MNILINYDYPGNIRELKSLIQSAVNLALGGRITASNIPKQIRTRAKRISQPILNNQEKTKAFSPLSRVETSYILKVYRHTGKNKSQTARILGIGINTLRRKLKSYGVE